MNPVLSVQGVGLRRGIRDVLTCVDVEASRGDLIALMGLSGTGKTSLLRAIAGLDSFETGTILVEGLALVPGRPDQAHLARVRRRVGMVFQTHALFEHLSALDNVCLAPVHVQRIGRADAVRHAHGLLDLLGVGSRSGAWPRELSGGEAQRVAIARALAMDPPLLLLDEPTASLDPARRLDLGRRLRALAAAGRALVMTSHDEDFVREHATTVLVLAEGRVVEAGDPRDVLDRPSHPATRALLRHDSA